MASHAQALHDESDVEEEALVNDYQQQVNNYDDELGDLTRTTSAGGASLSSQAQEALQAQLAAAATPLEFQATLETKFASYDNYCSLFHFILNSDGPVDFEAPSVCPLFLAFLFFFPCSVFLPPRFATYICGLWLLTPSL